MTTELDTTMSKLRVGMVGIGFIADWHSNGFKNNPDAAITGMCHVPFGDEKEKAAEMDRLKKKCAGLGVRAHASFESMVDDPDIDALIIGSINPYHFEQIKSGIAHGKHLMVEKPVVTDQTAERGKEREDISGPQFCLQRSGAEGKGHY